MKTFQLYIKVFHVQPLGGCPQFYAIQSWGKNNPNKTILLQLAEFTTIFS